MKITIYAKQMTVRESLKTMIEKKLMKFDKFFGDETEAFVTCRVRKGDKIIEITINYGGITFRSQIRRNKTRVEKNVRRGAFAVIDADDDDEYDEEDSFEIRTKSFPFKPMTPEEAILQMNLVGHEFFVFHNSEIGETSVVYKRKSGAYGLIVPET